MPSLKSQIFKGVEVGTADYAAQRPSEGKISAIERNRLILLRKAFNILYEKGPRLSVESFAALAEVSPATIYKHFDSKESLFSQTIIFHYVQWRQTLDQLLAEISGDLLNREIIRVNILLNLTNFYPKLVRATSNLYSSNPDILNELFERAGPRATAIQKVEKLTVGPDSFKMILFRGAYLALIFNVYQNNVESKEVDSDVIAALFSILDVKASRVKLALSIPVSDEKLLALRAK